MVVCKQLISLYHAISFFFSLSKIPLSWKVRQNLKIMTCFIIPGLYLQFQVDIVEAEVACGLFASLKKEVKCNICSWISRCGHFSFSSFTTEAKKCERKLLLENYNKHVKNIKSSHLIFSLLSRLPPSIVFKTTIFSPTPSLKLTLTPFFTHFLSFNFTPASRVFLQPAPTQA